MTGSVKVREPDHSGAREVYAALDLRMRDAYLAMRNTPDFDLSALENDLRAVCEQAGGTWIEMRFRPLVICFETHQARYRLSRTKNRYRCDIIGLSRIRKKKQT